MILITNRLTVGERATGAVGRTRVRTLVAAAFAAARCVWLAEGTLAWLGRRGAVVARLPAARTSRRTRCRSGALWLEAFDHVHRNQLLGEAFDALDVHAFSMIHQRDRQAVTAGTTGTADAVDVVFRELRQVVVEQTG
jgi:hypothetical protein